MINNTEKCSESCNKLVNYFYKNEDKCYNECFCESCKENYYPKDKEEKFKDLYFNCYKNPEGYYLDNDNIYKLCHVRCKKCIMEGNDINHNCLTCNNNFLYKIHNNIHYSIYHHFYKNN